MKANEYFVIALRVIGVVWVLYGLRELLDALLLSLGYFTQMDTSPRYYVVGGLFSFLAGLFLIRGAPLLAGFAFPDEEEEEEVEAAKYSERGEN
jgi:hypothetical protein